MKKFLFSLLIFFIPFALSAQTIFPINGNPINTCDGVFTDSGELSGDYSSNENFTTTICSTNPGEVIGLNFQNLDLASGDTLCVFDGSDISSPSLGCFDETSVNNFVVTATASNSSGCVTISFQSDATNEGAGWEAIITCAPPCQVFNAQIFNSTPSVNAGFIDICLGDELSISGTADFFQNNIFYNQSNSSSVFQWEMGDGNILTGENITHTYSQIGGYYTKLTITDDMGCTDVLEQAVKVTGVNSFAIENIQAAGNCEGDTVTLISHVDISDTLYFSNPLTSIVNFPIPDGVGVAYNSTILVNDFPVGSTLNNVMDFLGICMNAEHSWMRDLEIRLTCPSGNSVVLHNHVGNVGGEVFLGEPFADDEGIPEPIPGIGYDYCFVNNSPNGTFLDYANNVIGNNFGETLPAGEYQTFEDFSALLGCPLNGEWTLSIEDLWGIDNGFLFSWGLNIGGSSSSSQESFPINIAEQGWLPSPSIISNSGDTIEAQIDATETFTYQVTFENGCVVDTSIQQEVLPNTTPACFDCNNLIADAGPDVPFTCPEIVLDASNSTTGDFFEYEWTTIDGEIIGATDGLFIFALQPGEYIFTQTSSLTGCVVSDTIQVLPTVGTPTADGGGNIPFPCNADEVMLDGTNSTDGSDFIFSWTTIDGEFVSGENTLTPIVSLPGQYVLLVENTANGCSHTDIVYVEESVLSNIEITDATCDNADGVITVEIPSGTNNPNIMWSTGATGNSIQNLAQGWYSVSVTYNDTCMVEENIFVDEDLSCKVKISGIVYNDNVVQDCVIDGMTEGEDQIMLHLMPADIYTYTNFNGYYEFVVDNGDYTVEVILPSYLESLCPVDGLISVSAPTNGTFSTGNDFYINYIQGAFDLSVSCFMNLARPGMEHSYAINYCNDGDVAKSGTVTFIHDSQETNISVASFPQGWNYDEVTNTATWTFTNLQPGECLTQNIVLDLPTTINAGEILMGSLEITSDNGDDFEPNNNSKSWNQTVVASFDPNDKQVFTESSESEFGGMFYESDTTFAYQIRFQNTGTDTAFSVVIRDTLDAALDVTTIHPGISSHPYRLEFEGNNVLVFNFENIMLPDSNTNLAASQGFVTFTIDRRLDLPFGSMISNSAAIYFDYNAPVITNEVVSVLTEPVSINRLEKNAPLLEIYPNPNQGVFTIYYQLKKGSDIRFSILDMHGRDIIQVEKNGFQQTGNYSKDISIDNLASGIYFVQIKTEHGNVVKRFVKTSE